MARNKDNTGDGSRGRPAHVTNEPDAKNNGDGNEMNDNQSRIETPVHTNGAALPVVDWNDGCDHVTAGSEGEPIAYCDIGKHAEAEILARWQESLKSPPPPPILAYALACAKRGLYVMPCWWIEQGQCACAGRAADCSPGKHPIHTAVPRGVLDASIYPETITRWWRRFPKANLAIACGLSGIIVIDIDPRHGGSEVAFWAKAGPVIETWRTLTPSDGLHLWWKAPPGEFTVSVDKFSPGIDIRAGAGYVMVPPSNHLRGVYQFEAGYSPKEIELAPCPAVVAEFARIRLEGEHLNDNGAVEPQETKETGFDLLKSLQGVPEGQRDDTIFRVACAFRGSGMTKKLAIQLISEAALKCEPPFPVKTALRKINEAWRKYKPNNDQSDVELAYTQDWLALQFTEKHGEDLRYTDDWGQWHIWSEYVWRRDNTIHVYDLARDLCRGFSKEVPQAKVKKELAESKTVAAVERMCKADRRHAMVIDTWDSHALWLNCPGELIELDKNLSRVSARGDYCTKATVVRADSKMRHPLWTGLINRVLPDEELRSYLQRIAGYCLTGLVSEHALFFWYGLGANGKTTILNTMLRIMGDYALTTNSEILMVSKFERHPTEIAALQGARLVIANEIERGKTWAEAKLAELTGGNELTARFMRKDSFLFWPQFKLVISGNHKPSLRGVTEAMRRRFHMLPFTVTIPENERDVDLGEKLRAEWPAILAWMIEGFRMWSRDGLNAPKTAREATTEYLQHEDLVQEWINECCHVGGEFSALSSALFESWKKWAERNNEYVGTNKNLAQNLIEKGFQIDGSRRRGTLFQRITPSLANDSQDEPRF